VVIHAVGSSLGAWRSIERQEGIKAEHGLTFPLAILRALGAEHGGLDIVPEETAGRAVVEHDLIMVSVLDSRVMVHTGEHFARWGVPLRRADRHYRFPRVWAGGAGLYNPYPFWDVADLICLGDAEPVLPRLLDLWDLHGPGRRFDEAAAAIPGVAVPSVHSPADRLERVHADDIGVTLRNNISVNLDGLRRVEIARGCRFSCRFCSLGWYGPLRETPGQVVVDEIRSSGARVHLQAGDAESHTDIGMIRRALVEHGGVDTGWTGRVDTEAGEDGASVPGHKRFAFGVEGMTWEARQMVGKGYLTDARLVADTAAHLRRIEGDGKGRAAWHMITGLPGESPADPLGFVDRVLRPLDAAQRGQTPRNLSLHWQPFQPLPGTPMQWCGCGGGARRVAGQVRDATRDLRRVQVRCHAGRTDAMARLCTVLARSGPEAVGVLEMLAGGMVDPAVAVGVCGVGWGPLDPGGDVPWRRVVDDGLWGRLVRSYRNGIATRN
jgi:hypothetical protein